MYMKLRKDEELVRSEKLYTTASKWLIAAHERMPADFSFLDANAEYDKALENGPVAFVSTDINPHTNRMRRINAIVFFDDYKVAIADSKTSAEEAAIHGTKAIYGQLSKTLPRVIFMNTADRLLNIFATIAGAMKGQLFMLGKDITRGSISFAGLKSTSGAVQAFAFGRSNIYWGVPLTSITRFAELARDAAPPETDEEKVAQMIFSKVATKEWLTSVYDAAPEHTKPALEAFNDEEWVQAFGASVAIAEALKLGEETKK